MSALLDHRAASLADRFTATDGTVFLTAIQALVRMLVERARIDFRAGSEPGLFVSGYEGSPLAGYDLELGRRADLLAAHGVVHRPGLNEELAATAVVGTQLAGRIGTLRPSGVTGFWYGKAPGLDRSTDALRHANLIGTDPRGGAVALVGDDPAAKSSTVPSASEGLLADLFLPVFFPADAQDVLEHARHAVEMSRASGLWTAMKLVTQIADGAGTVVLDPDWRAPELGGAPYSHRPDGRVLGPQLAASERSLHETRIPLTLEYIRRSGLNRVHGDPVARVGIVAAGKSYLDVRQAMAALGLDEEVLSRSGVRLLKLDVISPLEPTGLAEFAAGLDEIVVVEEKRPFVEQAIRVHLYGRSDAPAVYGKYDGAGRRLFAPTGELDPDIIGTGLSRRLSAHGLAIPRPDGARGRRDRIELPLATRTPHFCSGCPHNSSTKVAPGTLVGAGIGCHTMVLLMPDADLGEIASVAQMGGEGLHWVGAAPFVEEQHLVQNMGDGTFAHSGSLAIRASVAAGSHVTYKILHNGAVAMTGGQDAVGGVGVDRLAALMQVEGVAKVVVTSDRPRRLRRRMRRQMPGGVQVRHRDDLLDVHRELAAVPGVTVLIHDQACAAEKRRKRKRGTLPTPTDRVVINERVCEGCGDCGTRSSCLSVHPVETEFGRKTRIHQSSCNFDYSCLSGDCPAFLTVRPGAGRSAPRSPALGPDDVAEPEHRTDSGIFAMRISGVGGTGVVTVAQVLATAAGNEGRHVRCVDQTGLAQKGGAVVSDLKFSDRPFERAARLADRECDLHIVADALVAAEPQRLSAMDPQRTVAVVSTTEVPTGAMVTDPSQKYPQWGRIASVLDGACRQVHYLDAVASAEALLGDAQFANMLLVGAAYQTGALPISAAAIERAITLNGAAVQTNLQAFRHGRRLVAEPVVGEVPRAETVADLLAVRVPELTAYQDAAYAAKYADFVGRVGEIEDRRCPGSTSVTAAVARNLYKLMAYKDEYEVARLSLAPELNEQLQAEFGAVSRRAFHLHPPVLKALGVTRKIKVRVGAEPAFRMLRAGRRLRGTRWDPFGRTEMRRLERELISEYSDAVESALTTLAPGNHRLVVELAELPDMVRGYEDVKLRNVAAYRARLAELRSAMA